MLRFSLRGDAAKVYSKGKGASAFENWFLYGAVGCTVSHSTYLRAAAQHYISQL